jgi:hypothetical protein
VQVKSIELAHSHGVDGSYDVFSFEEATSQVQVEAAIRKHRTVLNIDRRKRCVGTAVGMLVEELRQSGQTADQTDGCDCRDGDFAVHRDLQRIRLVDISDRRF